MRAGLGLQLVGGAGAEELEHLAITLTNAMWEYRRDMQLHIAQIGDDHESAPPFLLHSLRPCGLFDRRRCEGAEEYLPPNASPE
jgi:hypothetical protein